MPAGVPLSNHVPSPADHPTSTRNAGAIGAHARSLCNHQHVRSSRHLSRLRNVGMLVGLALLTGPTLACSGDDCESVDCALPGVTVRWPSGALPDATSVELCFDDDCAAVQPQRALDDLLVWRAFGDTRTIDITLRATGPNGTTTVTGRDRLRRPSCCLGLDLRLDGDRLRR